MKLLLLGATGPTGRQFLDAALQSGDSVTALVRNPTALSDRAEQVTLITGNATSERDVAAAMSGQDAVVSALGRGSSVTADDLFTRASAAVIGAAEETGVHRLVWLSAFGVGHTYDWASTPQKLIFRTLMRSIYANKEIADKRISSSALDWTVVYPTRLTDGAATGSFRSGERLPMTGLPTISRADVAAFMLSEAHQGEWTRRSVVISD